MKSKASIVLLGIVIFLLGAIAGAVSLSLYQQYLKAAFFKATSQPIDIVGGLAKELELNAQQTESLRKIFDDSIDRSITLSQEVWPKYQTIYKETEQKIKNILRDDQRARYEEFLSKFQAPPFPDRQEK